MIENKYDVYIRVDNKNRIFSVDSSAFLTDAAGWILIDTGSDYKHHHAQVAFFEKPLEDERGIKRYKTELIADAPEREAYCIYEYQDEQWGVYERTQEEMDADWVEPVPVPDPTERIAALEAAMTAIEEGIASV